MAEFFASVKNFFIVASIDGPENVHNAYRKYSNGKGSFQDAIRGLRDVVDAYGDKVTSSLSLSMVFGPPYTYEKIVSIQKFFWELDWLPKEVEKVIFYPEEGSVDDMIDQADAIDADNKDKTLGYVNPLFYWTKKALETTDRKSVFT